jgi:tyrosyl-tRNA synthetase
MMSPYAFHQFWLNAEDEKVGELLRTFTFLPREEIEALEARHAEKPFLREAQKVLADEVTSLVHGAAETTQAKAAAEALFGGGDITTLSVSTLAAALGEAGTVEVDASAGIPGVVDLLTLTGLAASKGEARRTVSEGGVYVNNVRVDDADHVPSGDDLIGGSWLVLRRGKKRFAGVRMR